MVCVDAAAHYDSRKHGVAQNGWGWNAMARSSAVSQHHSYNSYSGVMGCNNDSCGLGWLDIVCNGSRSGDNQSMKTQDYRVDRAECAMGPSQNCDMEAMGSSDGVVEG